MKPLRIVIRKFFPQDKNYVLEQVQLTLEQSLLDYLVDFVKVSYLLQVNPLGIEDEMAQKIKNHSRHEYKHLHDFYFTLMGVFRFKYYGDNQLNFDFDGREPYEKYEAQWSAQFKQWTKKFCEHRNFQRAVLDLTVFYPIDSPALLMDTRMETFLKQFFDFKIHAQKGIQKINVA